MRGILNYSAYVPFRRLQRSAISDLLGSGGGRGTRSVASFDEDSTSMGVEAARPVVRAGAEPDHLWFSTTEPAYADRTNATAIHAALRLPPSTTAIDMNGSMRSAVGALRVALEGNAAALVVSSDVRGGRAGSADEAGSGDGAAALFVGDGPVLAEYLGSGTATAEFIDRWRTPGDRSSRLWEDRFGEMQYVPRAAEAWAAALDSAGLEAGDIATVAVCGLHARAVRQVSGKLGVDAVHDALANSVGVAGAAQPAMVLASLLDDASPGDIVAVVVLSDGAEVLLFRVTEAITDGRPSLGVADQVAMAADLPYAKYLSWRGMLDLQGPNRPEPGRISASYAARETDWKYGFVGSVDDETGTIHLPPARVSIDGGETDALSPIAMADAVGTIVTLTVDKLAYSPSPPIVFAIVDFDGGGRMPVELTDCDADSVAIGDRIEMTFRRLFTADGIHNYFWKGRPVRGDR